MQLIMASRAPGAPKVSATCLSVPQRDQLPPSQGVHRVCPSVWKVLKPELCMAPPPQVFESSLHARFLRKASLLSPCDPVLSFCYLTLPRGWLLGEGGGWWWGEDPALSFLQHSSLGGAGSFIPLLFVCLDLVLLTAVPPVRFVFHQLLGDEYSMNPSRPETFIL